MLQSFSTQKKKSIDFLLNIGGRLLKYLNIGDFILVFLFLLNIGGRFPSETGLYSATYSKRDHFPLKKGIAFPQKWSSAVEIDF